jgi:hypothetical protein
LRARKRSSIRRERILTIVCVIPIDESRFQGGYRFLLEFGHIKEALPFFELRNFGLLHLRGVLYHRFAKKYDKNINFNSLPAHNHSLPYTLVLKDPSRHTFLLVILEYIFVNLPQTEVNKSHKALKL